MNRCALCGQAIKRGLELCYFCFESTTASSHNFPDPIVSGKFMKQMGIASN